MLSVSAGRAARAEEQFAPHHGTLSQRPTRQARPRILTACFKGFTSVLPPPPHRNVTAHEQFRKAVWVHWQCGSIPGAVKNVQTPPSCVGVCSSRCIDNFAIVTTTWQLPMTRLWYMTHCIFYLFFSPFSIVQALERFLKCLAIYTIYLTPHFPPNTGSYDKNWTLFGCAYDCHYEFLFKVSSRKIVSLWITVDTFTYWKIKMYHASCFPFGFRYQTFEHGIPCVLFMDSC